MAAPRPRATGIAKRGVRNLLIHAGILPGVRSRGGPRWLDMPSATASSSASRRPDRAAGRPWRGGREGSGRRAHLAGVRYRRRCRDIRRSGVGCWSRGTSPGWSNPATALRSWRWSGRRLAEIDVTLPRQGGRSAARQSHAKVGLEALTTCRRAVIRPGIDQAPGTRSPSRLDLRRAAAVVTRRASFRCASWPTGRG